MAHPPSLDRRKTPLTGCGGATSAAKASRKSAARTFTPKTGTGLHLHATKGCPGRRKSSKPYSTSIKNQGLTKTAHTTTEAAKMTGLHALSEPQNHAKARLESPNRTPEPASCQCHLLHGSDRVSDIRVPQTPLYRHGSRDPRKPYLGIYIHIYICYSPQSRPPVLPEGRRARPRHF